MSKKLLLIDGSSMLATSFFGNLHPAYMKTGDTSKLMRTKDGRFTNGVYTMSKILLNLIKKQNPSHIAVAWDISRETFRREMYSEYKGTRSETKPELGEQFPLMQGVLDSMNIPQFKVDRFEADDIIGTFSTRFEQELPVYILTKDQDSLQLITDRTRVWLGTNKSSDMYKERGMDASSLPIPDGHFEFTPLTFEEEYGLKPSQMVDKKAIEGDTSDNIPGVKGVGAASAVPLLQEYGTIESIYEAIDSTSEDELKAFFKTYLGIKRSPINHLIAGRDSAFLSKTLATIKTDIDELSPVRLSDLELHFDHQATKKAFIELEFKSLIEKV
jgi:5'-3' exonuclease